jgi:hypothetical protein
MDLHLNSHNSQRVTARAARDVAIGGGCNILLPHTVWSPLPAPPWLRHPGAKLAPFNWGGVSARIALRKSMTPCRIFSSTSPPPSPKKFWSVYHLRGQKIFPDTPKKWLKKFFGHSRVKTFFSDIFLSELA